MMVSLVETQNVSFLGDDLLVLRLMDVARAFLLAQIFMEHSLSSWVH